MALALKVNRDAVKQPVDNGSLLDNFKLLLDSPSEFKFKKNGIGVDDVKRSVVSFLGGIRNGYNTPLVDAYRKEHGIADDVKIKTADVTGTINAYQALKGIFDVDDNREVVIPTGLVTEHEIKFGKAIKRLANNAGQLDIDEVDQCLIYIADKWNNENEFRKFMQLDEVYTDIKEMAVGANVVEVSDQIDEVLAAI